MTVFWKTDNNFTNNETHFLLVHVLSRDINHLTVDGQVFFYRRHFFNAVEPQGYISWPIWP